MFVFKEVTSRKTSTILLGTTTSPTESVRKSGELNYLTFKVISRTRLKHYSQSLIKALKLSRIA